MSATLIYNTINREVEGSNPSRHTYPIKGTLLWRGESDDWHSE